MSGFGACRIVGGGNDQDVISRLVLATGAVVLAVIGTGCGAADPTTSEEYVALTVERDALVERLEEAEDEVDDLRDDLVTVIGAVIVQGFGAPPDATTCIGDAIVADPAARDAIMGVVAGHGSEDVGEEVEDAVSDALEGCGVDIDAVDLEDDCGARIKTAEVAVEAWYAQNRAASHPSADDLGEYLREPPDPEYAEVVRGDGDVRTRVIAAPACEPFVSS